MSFTQSLSAFKYLSELYARDDASAVLMTEYPSSNSDETRFQNRSKYIIHDSFPPPPIGLLKTLGPHHLMYGWGNKLPVTSELSPPDALTRHWQKVFGDAGCPDWQPINDDQCYITSFPFESLPKEQQVIDPSILYDLHSKEAIEHIPCSQAEVYDEVQFPCIIKLSHGYAGLGNYLVRNQSDLDKAKANISERWPEATLVINQLLTDIIGDYGVQFYLNKQGEMTWIGFTQQVFNQAGRWTGGVFNATIQDELYEDFLKPAKAVSEYLHQKGYFGVVGIDILQNQNDEYFLVDLNPRLTGITPFLIASRLFIPDGYLHGIYSASLELTGSPSDLIKRVEAIDTARVLLLSYYQAPGSATTKCHVSVSGKTLNDCEEALVKLISSQQ